MGVRTVKLYSIRRWEEFFENNRSRCVKDCRWVAIPNRHDGEHYTQIMADKDGATIFSGWVLLVQVASKCYPRGTLIKDDGSPHTPLSLSLKTRAPEKWFTVAIEFLTRNTDWLDVQDLASPYQDADSRLIGDEQAIGIEGNGKKGMERRERENYSPGFLEFWSHYPKKRDKESAWKAWKRVGCEPLVGIIVQSLDRWKNTREWKKDGGQYIPHPTTWLNGRRWEDELKIEIRTTEPTI